LYPKNCIKLLAGCAPCQPFSTYSQGRDSSIDKKWPLLYSFSRLIRETLPEIVTMENVPDVTKHKVYHDFVGELEKLGYNIWADKVYCPDYGVPQVRKRHVLLASRVSGISLIPATTPKHKHLTVSDTIKSWCPLASLSFLLRVQIDRHCSDPPALRKTKLTRAKFLIKPLLNTAGRGGSEKVHASVYDNHIIKTFTAAVAMRHFG